MTLPHTTTGGKLDQKCHVQAAGNTSPLAIAPRVLKVTTNARSRSYGNVNPVLTYSFSGLLSGDAKITPLERFGNHARAHQCVDLRIGQAKVFAQHLSRILTRTGRGSAIGGRGAR